MRRKRHEKIILSKKRNNRALRVRIDLNRAISSHFGYIKEFILNPEE